MREVNPEEWRNIVGLMKGTGVWDEVKRTYPELKTEDEIADEVLAHYSGRRGAERLRAEQEKIAKGDGDVVEKAEAISALNRVKDALKRFWKGVADWLGIHFTSAEDVADKVLSDLLNGVDPNAGREGASSARRMQADAEIAEIVAKAKADGTYMKAPNGKPSKLSPRQWSQVRTKAFKRWFGDWEKAFKKNFLLNGKAVSILKGDEFEKKEGVTLTRQVSDYFESVGGKAHSPIFGDVVLDRDGAEDSLAHGMGRLKAIAYAGVKGVIEGGIVIDYDVDHKGRGYDSAVVAAPIEISGDRYICYVVITRKKNNSRYYLHEVWTEKNLTDVRSSAAQRQPSQLQGTAKVLQSIVTANENCSKVVDENGEPLVVYHGTQEEFSVFENYVASNMYGEPFSDGYMFSDESSASNYGEPMALFLNIKNLEDYRDKGKLLDVVERYFDDFNNQTDEFYFESAEDAVSAFSEIIAEDGRLYHDEGSIELNQAEAMWHVLQNKLKSLAEESGFDGFVINDSTRGDEHVSYCAFEPTQIKSATDNVGTFDGSNPDIRYQFVGEKGAAAMDKASNRKGGHTSPSNTQLSARDYDVTTSDAANVAESSGHSKLSGEKIEGGRKAMLRRGGVPGSAMTAAERRRLGDAARGFASGIGLGEVEVYDRIENVPGYEEMDGRWRRAKGWFDPATGRVAVVAGNHVDAADIQQTAGKGFAHPSPQGVALVMCRSVFRSAKAERSLRVGSSGMEVALVDRSALAERRV